MTFSISISDRATMNDFHILVSSSSLLTMLGHLARMSSSTLRMLTTWATRKTSRPLVIADPASPNACSASTFALTTSAASISTFALAAPPYNTVSVLMSRSSTVWIVDLRAARAPAWSAAVSRDSNCAFVVSTKVM